MLSFLDLPIMLPETPSKPRRKNNNKENKFQRKNRDCKPRKVKKLAKEKYRSRLNLRKRRFQIKNQEEVEIGISLNRRK